MEGGFGGFGLWCFGGFCLWCFGWRFREGIVHDFLFVEGHLLERKSGILFFGELVWKMFGLRDNSGDFFGFCEFAEFKDTGEVCDKVGDVLVSFGGVGFGGFVIDGIKEVMAFGVVEAKGIDLSFEDLSGEHLGKENAQGEDIGATIACLSIVHFGCDVKDTIGLILVGVLEARERERNSESKVGDFEEIGQHDHVVWFEVSVKDRSVSVFESLSDLREDRDDLFELKDLLFVFAEVDDLAEGETFEVLHGEEEDVAVDTFVVNAYDVGVVEFSYTADIFAEFEERFGSAQVLGQDNFECHVKIKVAVVDFEHSPQRARTENFFDFVAVCDGGTDAVR